MKASELYVCPPEVVDVASDRAVQQEDEVLGCKRSGVEEFLLDGELKFVQAVGICCPPPAFLPMCPARQVAGVDEINHRHYDIVAADGKCDYRKLSCSRLTSVDAPKSLGEPRGPRTNDERVNVDVPSGFTSKANVAITAAA